MGFLGAVTGMCVTPSYWMTQRSEGMPSLFPPKNVCFPPLESKFVNWVDGHGKFKLECWTVLMLLCGVFIRDMYIVPILMYVTNC